MILNDLRRLLSLSGGLAAACLVAGAIIGGIAAGIVFGPRPWQE